MAVARDIEESVDTGVETRSVNGKNHGSGASDAAEDYRDAARPSAENKPASDAKPDTSPLSPASASADSHKGSTEGEPGLGKILTGARERRGVSRAQVAEETRIPSHYIDMIESSDYGLISDQLYLMPFLRRYAAFLKLDGEEIAMRFVREVQRAESVAATQRMSEPLETHDPHRLPWGRIAAVVAVLSAIVVLYVIVSERHRGEFGFHHAPAPVSAPAQPAASGAPVTAPGSAGVLPAAPAAPSVSDAAVAPQSAAPAQIPAATAGGANPSAPTSAQPGKAPAASAAPGSSDTE